MNNPFELINSRLSNIESLLIEIKHGPDNEPRPTDQPEQLLTIQEAAKFLSLSVPTMYSKVSRSEIPSRKAGKRLYFLRSELMEQLNRGRRKTAGEIEQEAKAYLSNTKKGLNNG